MSVRITMLCENTAGFGFLAEWGLSMLVETDGHAVLLDTGMSRTATHNAQLLGVDLTKLDAIVLSHGHVDHTGGLREVLRLSGPKKVLAHPGIWVPKYYEDDNGVRHHIGVPFVRDELESLGAEFILSKVPTHVAPGFVTSGEVPMRTTYEAISAKSFHKPENRLEPDPFPDDLGLAVKTDKGLVVLLGCAHRGPVNTIKRLVEATGDTRIHAIVGGTHLKDASADRINETIRAFKAMQVEKVAVAHCTGFKATAMFAEAFGEAFVDLNAGKRISLQE
jgi:7,8-dihydropterin-6-yl-methyl-4-(beta-D-ribofuranosyl)aminobenzene 5'-phosphate synthase